MEASSTFDPFAEDTTAPSKVVSAEYDPFADATPVEAPAQPTGQPVAEPGESMESSFYPIPETGKLIGAVAYGVTTGNADPGIEALEDLAMKGFGRIQALGSGTRDLGLGTYQFGYDNVANAMDDPEMEYQANLFTHMTQAERLKMQKEIKNQFGDDIQMKFFKEAGKIVPFFIFGGAGQKAINALQSGLKNVAGMSGAGATIASGSIVGTLAGAMSSPLDFKDSALLQDRIEQDKAAMQWGAGIGGFLGPTLSLFPALKNLIRDKIETSIDPVRLKEMEGLIEETGVDTLTLGQVTGSPLVESGEAIASKSPDVMRRREELDRNTRGKFRQMFDDVMDKFKNVDDFGPKAKKAYDDTLHSLVDNRKTNGEILFPGAQKVAMDEGKLMIKTMTPEQRAAYYQQHSEFKELGNDVEAIDELIKDGRIIRGDNYLKTLRKMIAEAKVPNAHANPGDQARVIADLESRLSKFTHGKKVGFIDKYSEAVEKPKSKTYMFMSPAEMQSNLASYGQVIKVTGNELKDISNASSERIYRKLRTALYEDLNVAANSKLPGARELKKARDTWAKDSIPIEELRDTGLETIFGQKVLKDDKQLRNAFVNMDAKKLDSVLHILESQAPDLRASLAKDWLGNAIESATSRGANPGLAKFDNLFNGSEVFKVADMAKKFEVVFKDPATRKRIEAGLDLWAKIKPIAQSQGRLDQMMQAGARVAVSRDPIFAAGLAQQLFTPSALAKVLTHKDGLKVLRELSKPFNSVRWGGAMLEMAKMTGAYNDMADMKKQDRQTKMEEMQRRFLEQGGQQAM